MSLLFFDTETTGTPRSRSAPLQDLDNWPRIVQVAWLVTDDQGRERSSHVAIARPDGFVIPADATRIHGISTERAKREGVPLGGILTAFRAALQTVDTVVAHNYEFDYMVTAAEFLRHSMPDPFAAHRHFCTMRSGASLTRIPGRRGDFKWPTLAELHTHLFGHAPAIAHDALADVQSCARCYVAMGGRDGQPVRTAREPAVAAEDDDLLLSEVEDLVGSHTWFNADFVESLRGQFDEKGWMSEKQRAALVRIRDKLSE